MSVSLSLRQSKAPLSWEGGAPGVGPASRASEACHLGPISFALGQERVGVIRSWKKQPQGAGLLPTSLGAPSKARREHF